MSDNKAVNQTAAKPEEAKADKKEIGRAHV